MRTGLRWLAVAVLVSVAPAALAERPPQKRDDAQLVVVGKVGKVATRESKFGGDGISTGYTAQVEVEKVDRGKGAKAGDTVSVHWFHVTKRPTRPFPGAYGHAYAIKAKDTARFWLMKRGKDGWEVIYNSNGVEKLTK